MIERGSGPAERSEQAGPIYGDHRGTLWLPLLRQLTSELPRWVVIKNAKAALDDVGDVDSFAAPADWPIVERTFRRWAAEHDLPVLGVCRHIWRGPHFVARDPSSPYLLVLDVKAMRSFRGSSFVTVDEALALSEMDALGFRRVRGGAEGVIKLLMNGTRRGGRANERAIHDKHILESLRDDPSGASLAADLIVGPAAAALKRGVRAAADGRWSRTDMATVEAWFVARALVRPDWLARQMTFRMLGERCPLVRITRRERRRMPDDSTAWLAEWSTMHAGTSFLGADAAAA